MSAGSPRYPLRAAQALRQSETEQQKHKLEREHAELVRAERELDEARAALDTQRAAMRAAEAANAGDAGAASALELQRGAAFAERQRGRARGLRAAAVLAEARVQELKGEIARRKQALAAAHAAEQVLERDAERFAQGERKRAEALEQREQEERRR